MVQSIYEYEKIYDDAIAITQKLLAYFKSQFKNYDSIDVDLDTVNYDDIIYQYETNIAILEKEKVRYKFDKLSREEYDIILKNVAEGKPTNVITIGKEHKLRKLDTLQLLSVLYGISIETLLSYNKISPDDFDDLKEIKGSVKIPITINIQDRTRYSDLPVFGTISGNNAWGTDWQNELSVNSQGDIRVLNNQDTLVQGISNRFGDYGDIPGYENEVIDLDWGRDYPPSVIDTMILAKLTQVLKREPRIREVKDIKIETQGIGKTVTVDIIPINGTESIQSIINNKVREVNNVLNN